MYFHGLDLAGARGQIRPWLRGRSRPTGRGRASSGGTIGTDLKEGVSPSSIDGKR